MPASLEAVTAQKRLKTAATCRSGPTRVGGQRRSKLGARPPSAPVLGATGGPGSLPRRDEPAGGWPPRPGCSVQPRPSPEAAPRAGTSVLPRPAETDLTGVDRATSVSGSPPNVGRNGRARLSCGGRTQRASASASPRYASERDSQSRHCQSTTVACRTKGRGGSGWCGRIGGVSGGLSPPEHLLRATAPGGSARWRDSIAIVVSGFKSKITFAGFAQTRDIILKSLPRVHT